MNILIPDSWLREFLITKANPKQIKEYLSLCGPSVERIHKESGEPIYDIEITTNRPDAMSVVGVAREAAAILPRFGIPAKLLHDPYAQSVRPLGAKIINKTLTIKTDPILNPRWTSMVFENVTIKPSPDWLKKKLEATGMRSINNIIDITNYLMRAYGQPAHAFDFDAISDKANHATMILRASKKGERLITLDGKSHTLPGEDIVIQDEKGRLIDLCGVMGAQNSAIKSTTKTVILFLQTYDPTHIRKTMMHLSHRTEAGGLFEKGTDPELVLPAFAKGTELMTELAGGQVASKLYDIYPKPYKPYSVSVSRSKSDAYIGKHLADKEIIDILKPLGFQTNVIKDNITVTVPSFRRDVTIDVDIIEELARIYGYHAITPTLPDSAPPVTMPDPQLNWEEEIKVRLRDWGYTETYTYSMISEELMDIFGLDKTKAYKIANPLSNEWVYMRPTLQPSVFQVIKENLNTTQKHKLFELSMIYEWSPETLPKETPILVVAWSGNHFLEAKGLAESLYAHFGIPFPNPDPKQPLEWKNPNARLSLGTYGSIGLLRDDLQHALGIAVPITILDLNIAKMVAHAHPQQIYIPIPKYPASYEDLAFVLPPQTSVGPILTALKSAHPLVSDVELLDSYENTRTFHITYQDPTKNLTQTDIQPIRSILIELAAERFNATLKNI
ncbi:phenylalanine--tRNA ligase subunit beta [Candidatus Gottesmanbacteria bacterium]|nr:phenylalanine--tRNA ligase subunit beta [Candidatus Gottesmanbacteria bacterium]